MICMLYRFGTGALRQFFLRHASVEVRVRVGVRVRVIGLGLRLYL